MNYVPGQTLQCLILLVANNSLAHHSLKTHLQEQHEGNPLVVGVIPSFIFTFNVGPYSRVGYMASYRLALLMW
jgi:hypothetical protein